jgi:predicted ATPase
MMMLPPIPSTLNEATMAQYLRSLSLALNQTMNDVSLKSRAQPSVLLVSPAGKVYTVRVTDLGVLETELAAE